MAKKYIAHLYLHCTPLLFIYALIPQFTFSFSLKTKKFTEVILILRLLRAADVILFGQELKALQTELGCVF